MQSKMIDNWIYCLYLLADWDGEIQSTIDEDRNGTIHHYMDKGCQIAQESCPSAASGVTAVDFGCGVCKWIPALVERCKYVEGIDISRRLLEVMHSFS